MKFHELKVTSIERAAEDATCVTLAIPEALRGEFRFDAGQYVTVRRAIEGREERRTYSIVAPPGAGVLRLGVREQSGGRMSREIANVLRAGEMLEVGTPAGRFRTAVDPGRSHSYVAFASGSGITPVLSLLTDILAREPRSQVTLIYGNRSAARAMFLEDVLALKNRYVDRFAVHFIMSREPHQTALFNGRIDAAKVAEFAGTVFDPKSVDEYFICGPGSMVEDVRTALKSLSGEKPIRFERFAAAIPPGRSGDANLLTSAPVAAAPEVPLATISVTMDGRRRTFPMSTADASVLEAAERAGLELPFSCRSGICATCRTRIIEGGAVMSHNIALEPWEIEAGFVLCCQARPTGKTLELSYDEK